MLTFDWFEAYDADELNAAQLEFLAVLRERARRWPCMPNATELAAPGDGCTQWRAVVDISAEIENLGLITVGVCFDGYSMRASEVHNQSYCPYPADRSRIEVLEATGAPQELGELAATWFERILRRPVLYREWVRHGQVACEWGLADPEQWLVARGSNFPRVGKPDRFAMHPRGQAPQTD